MLSVRSPSGAITAMTTARISNSPPFHVSLRPVRATTKSTMMVISDPPITPSTVFDGLIHERSGVRPIDDPTSSAPMSLATTPRTTRNSVSVPQFSPPVFDRRTMSAANDPSTPIHTMPSVVMAMFGSGPDSTPWAPRNPAAPAMKAKDTTSGSEATPTQ
jgi:hypothetical protein